MCDNMDGPLGFMLSERAKQRQILLCKVSYIYMELKNKTVKLIQREN